MPPEPAPPSTPSQGEGAGTPPPALAATNHRPTGALEALPSSPLLGITLEAMTDGVVVCDHAGRVLHLNSAMRAFYARAGLPTAAETTLAQRHRALDIRRLDGTPLARDEWPIARLLRGEVLSGGDALQAEVRLRDGTTVIESFTGAPLHDQDGQVRGVVCVMRDITESYRLAQRVRERASQLETIFESITDAVFIYDAAGHIVEMNDAARRTVGLDHEPQHQDREARERAARYDMCDERGAPLPYDQWPITRILRGEVLMGDHAADVTITTLVGERLRVSYAGAPVRDDAGHIVGAVGVCRDVTQRRHLEAQSRIALEVLLEVARVLGDPQAPLEMVGLLKRVSAILRRLEAVDFVHAMMVEIDEIDEMDEMGGDEGHLVPICMVGVAPEVEARWKADISAATIAQVPGYDAVFARLRAGKLFVQRLDREAPLLSVGAVTSSHVQAGITAPVVVEGQIRALLTLGRARPPDPSSASGFAPWDEDLLADVARLIGEALAHASRADQLRAAETARTVAEETTRERDDFIGIAGHELRTPLTTITANAQLLDRGLQQLRTLIAAEPPDPAVLDTRLARLSEHVQRISRRGAVLARLINDLVEVSRIHAQRLDLAERSCDLAPLLREIVAEQRHMNGEREIRLVGLGSRVALPAHADPDRIAQVLTNLVTNALKYSPSTTPVVVVVSHDQELARVAVRDEGPGLTAEQQRRVWDRFYRVPGIEVQSGSGVGLGLGLFISREIVERHGGTVGIESTPGTGSTFWFTLPLLSAHVRTPAASDVTTQGE